ncbi:MAG: kelch repeat-containing protein [Acidobacteriota bacterium]
MRIIKALGQYYTTRVRGAIVRRWHRREDTVMTFDMTEFMWRNGATAAKQDVARFARLFLAVFAILGFCEATASAQNRGAIVPTGDMITARSGHTATLLLDGRVLLAGGGTSSAEIYDPSTGTFTATGSMNESRQSHSATLLPDGNVLIAGGRGDSSAELYVPKTGTFTVTGSMIDDQFGHSATLLRNGKVLIAGGERKGPPWPTAAAAELYDPITGKFSLLGSYAGSGLFFSGGPIWPTANMLPDGRVLLAGENPPEIYDPATETFALSGGMTEGVFQYGMYWHTATSLRDGTVLVSGGNDDWTCGGLANAEIYDPSSGTFKATGKMSTSRDIHTATLLSDGTVLMAGGGSGWCGRSTNRTAELYDPVSGSFEPVGRMAQSRSGHTATLLGNGTVLIAGGTSYWPMEVLRSAELYQPAASRPRQRSVHH